MKKTIFIKNAAILTISGLILRFAGIIFKVWMAAALGAVGMGLYQIVFSLYLLFSTFATSGINTAVTRLVADEQALGSKRGIKRILFVSFCLTLLAAALSFGVLLIGGDFIALRLLEDSRTALPLKILAFSLPFMGLSSVLKGYFIARAKALPNALSQLFEQAVRIIAIVVFLTSFKSLDVEYGCAAVILGDTIAEILSFLFIYIFYRLDLKGLIALSGRSFPPYRISKELIRISLPISLGRYLNTLLRTVENILVPKMLSLFSASAEKGLALFGMIKGMALPLLFFPSTLLNALSTLLLPEMSQQKAMGNRKGVARLAERVIKITAIIGFIAGGIFLVAGKEIGAAIYKEQGVGELVVYLAPIVPLMYLDSVCDGLLKGLDKQKYTFYTALFDSSIRILLIILIMPRLGINGFLGIMYFSNLFTFLLHLIKLIKASGAKIKIFEGFVYPAFLSLFIALCTDTVLRGLLRLRGLVYIIPFCLVSVLLYIFLISLNNKGIFRELGKMSNSLHNK